MQKLITVSAKIINVYAIVYAIFQDKNFNITLRGQVNK